MEPDIRITLFGRFSVQCRTDHVDHVPSKVQELVAYLLLHPGSHPREALAELIWGENESCHSRKYLRQALWQLHVGLLAVGKGRASRLVHQEPGWVELKLNGSVWVDAMEFEDAFNWVRGRATLTRPEAQRLVATVQLYSGDLLRGKRQRWCHYERERYREMYLTLLDKLIRYCREQGEFDAGIAFSTLALQCDRARERTHQNLMALYRDSGDRSGALRQYERCASALREELGIEPCRETEELHRTVLTGSMERNGTRANGNGASPLLVLTEPEPVTLRTQRVARAASSRSGPEEAVITRRPLRRPQP